MKVAATPVILLMVISGVPVNPSALVAVVAEVALPDNVPEKVVAVTIPPKAVIALPTFRVAAVATPRYSDCLYQEFHQFHT